MCLLVRSDLLSDSFFLSNIAVVLYEMFCICDHLFFLKLLTVVWCCFFFSGVCYHHLLSVSRNSFFLALLSVFNVSNSTCEHTSFFFLFVQCLYTHSIFFVSVFFAHGRQTGRYISRYNLKEATRRSLTSS